MKERVSFAHNEMMTGGALHMTLQSSLYAQGV